MPKENKNGKALSEEKLDKVSGGGLSGPKSDHPWAGAWAGIPRDLLAGNRLSRDPIYKNKSSDKKS